MKSEKSPSRWSPLRALLLRAWRERWSDVHWAINSKAVLPKGILSLSDGYEVCSVILEQATMGPAPNRAIVGYLRHALASRSVSHAAVFKAIAEFYQFVDRPHCADALLHLIDSIRSHMRTCAGMSQTAGIDLAVQLLQISGWLLRLISESFDEISKNKSAPNILTKNVLKALEILKELADADFSLALLYIGRHEDPELFSKLTSTCKQLSDQMRQSHALQDECPSFRPDMTRLLGILKVIDPAKLISPEATTTTTTTNSMFLLHAFQPILVFNVALQPQPDLNNLSLQLFTLATTYNLTFSDVVYYILRSSLSSIGQKPSLEALKWEAFVFYSLPKLLEILAAQMKIDTWQLKTPTEVYKAFDRLLRSEESLLDSTDLRFKCNVVEILLRLVNRSQPALMTETELDDVLKKRQGCKTSATVETTGLTEDVVGQTCSFDRLGQAAGKLAVVLEHLETDCSKTDNIEKVLGYLASTVDVESLNLLLVVASAEGKLRPFLKAMVKCNQRCQESLNETVKNSLLRAALFDLTFLMLTYSVHCFSAEVVRRELSDTAMENFMKEALFDSGRPLSSSTGNLQNNADVLIKQLNSGELRTQLVQWQNVCGGMEQAMRDMLLARSAGQLHDDNFAKMINTANSKMFTCGVELARLLLNCRLSAPQSRIHVDAALQKLFEEIAEDAAEEEEEEVDAVAAQTQIPCPKERRRYRNSVLQRLQEKQGRRSAAWESLQLSVGPQAPLTEVLGQVWQHVVHVGMVDVDTLVVLRDLYEVGGAAWFVHCLVEELLGCVYQDDLDGLTHLLVSVFHVALEECTLALLTRVAPSYLQQRHRSPSGASAKGSVPCPGDRLTDPHGAALANVIARCTYAILIPYSIKSFPSDIKVGMKRPLMDAAEDDFPSAKMRKTIGGFGSTPSADSPRDSADDQPIAAGLSTFFQLLNASVPDCSMNPCAIFAVRFLEQVVRLGKWNANLVLQHMSKELVVNLVNMVPDMFSATFVTQLFDATLSVGRESMAQVLCHLNTLHKERLKVEEF